jgi:hypothetical protein
MASSIRWLLVVVASAASSGCGNLDRLHFTRVDPIDAGTGTRPLVGADGASPALSDGGGGNASAVSRPRDPRDARADRSEPDADAGGKSWDAAGDAMAADAGLCPDCGTGSGGSGGASSGGATGYGGSLASGGASEAGACSAVSCPACLLGTPCCKTDGACGCMPLFALACQ